MREPDDSRLSPIESAEQPGGSAVIYRWMSLFIMLGIAWRVLRFSLAFPIWGDEAFILCGVMTRGYGELFSQPPIYFQVVPLLHLWAQRLAFELLGPGELSLRLFSLMAGCVALLVFARIARQRLDAHAATIAVGIFACGYPLVRHACEAKPYGGDVLAAMLILWAGLHWADRPTSIARAALLTFVSAVMIWLSFPAVLVIAGVGAALAAYIPRRHWPLLIGYAVATAASFLVYYFTFAKMQSSRSAGSWLEDYWIQGFPTLSDPLGTLVWLVRAHTSDMMGYPVGGTQFRSAGTFVFFAIGTATLLRGDAARRRLALLLIAPFVVSMAAAIAHRYPYGVHARLAQHLAPMICLLTGVGIAAAVRSLPGERARQIGGAAAGALLLILPIAGMARDVSRPYKSVEDVNVRGAIRELKAIAPPGATIAVLNPMEFGEQPDLPPQFASTPRYYLMAAGYKLVWCAEDETPTVPRDTRWVVTCHREKQPPSAADVAAILKRSGLSIRSMKSHLYLPTEGKRLDIYECAPSE